MNPKIVSACITCVSFPEELDQVVAMIDEHGEAFGRAVTDMELLLTTRHIEGLAWSAPKWLLQDDVVFFYHAISAKARAIRLRKEAKVLGDDLLVGHLNKAVEYAERFGGTIFGCARAVSPAQHLGRLDGAHFDGRVFVEIDDLFMFDRPVPKAEFSEFVTLNPQGTITYMGESACIGVHAILAKSCQLPDYLEGASFADRIIGKVSNANWKEAAIRGCGRFRLEEQARANYFDYLLRELKDSRTSLLEECNCFRTRKLTGTADYFMCVGGRWIPVEAKLNILAEADLPGQIRQYLGIERFVPTRGTHRGREFTTGANDVCLVVDQRGLYVTRGGEFVESTPDEPLLRTEDLILVDFEQTRRQLMKATS